MTLAPLLVVTGVGGVAALVVGRWWGRGLAGRAGPIAGLVALALALIVAVALPTAEAPLDPATASPPRADAALDGVDPAGRYRVVWVRPAADDADGAHRSGPGACRRDAHRAHGGHGGARLHGAADRRRGGRRRGRRRVAGHRARARTWHDAIGGPRGSRGRDRPRHRRDRNPSGSGRRPGRPRVLPR